MMFLLSVMIMTMSGELWNKQDDCIKVGTITNVHVRLIPGCCFIGKFVLPKQCLLKIDV